MANANPSPASRFTPGRSGNPGGRPRSAGLTEKLREALEATGGDGRTLTEQLVDALVKIALDGDRQAIKDVFDRVEGKPVGDPSRVMTVEEATRLVASVCEIIKRHVSDPGVLAAISRDVGRLSTGVGPSAEDFEAMSDAELDAYVAVGGLGV